MSFFKRSVFLCIALFSSLSIEAQNQTPLLSPVFSEEELPFKIRIEEAPFSLPAGIQGYASAIYEGKWLLFAGRSNGLHGFSNVGNNFPPAAQNKDLYVIDPLSGKSWSRSLTTSDLSQEQIDALSVTAPQSFQKGGILYLVGGYGINTLTGEMETKKTLTTLSLSKVIKWVLHEEKSLQSALFQTKHPYLQVTGGFLFQANDHSPLLLMLGQNFQGLYQEGSNGKYTHQIRPFWIQTQGKQMTIFPKKALTVKPSYRRRDLNIVPILQDDRCAYVAFGGVFTLETGVWTVPITIFPDGSSKQPDPSDPATFKQAMNHYNCPTFGLYSTHTKTMFVLFPGGISFGYYSEGSFLTDSEFPFINQVTTIKINSHQQFTQHLMEAQYPSIISSGSNPGNPLLFGAEAQFFPREGLPLFSNGVIQLDQLPKKPTLLGYIVGGIMSTLPNTNFATDSTSSPYVFSVTLIPK